MTLSKRLALALALSLFAGQAALAQDDAPPPRVLSVVGEGEVRGAPDMATVTLAVVSEGAAAREALDANSASMTAILEALKAGGIATRDLQTSGFSIEPRYSQPPRNFNGETPFEPKIVGYTVRNSITVRIRELPRVGEILDQVVTLGANSISGPAFAVAEPQTLEDEARRAAVADARRKAELYATAAGVSLGPVARIEENAGPRPRPMPMGAMARMSAEADSVPVEGGELTYRAEISVTWTLAE